MIETNHQLWNFMHNNEFAQTSFARFVEAGKTLPHGIAPPDCCFVSGNLQRFKLLATQLLDHLIGTDPEYEDAHPDEVSTCMVQKVQSAATNCALALQTLTSSIFGGDAAEPVGNTTLSTERNTATEYQLRHIFCLAVGVFGICGKSIDLRKKT